MDMTGRFMDAREALCAGLVSRVVPQGELLGAARELAGQILSRGRSPSGLPSSR
ncbi:hypothetical protein [Rubrobacter xylanophilus]|uniref:hypothetical protein n=1 Tax=Rubrobacter xylanophilus TaxID=49319 RepID=UPI00003A27F2|nr:hypothetical protein [Rubrobacter xylanophilus]